MSNREIWFISGAGRGMGVDIAKASPAAGHAVVASGRDSDRVSGALGQSNDLLDVTSRADAEAAVRAAVDRILVEQVLYPTMPRFDHVNQRDTQRGDRDSRYGCGWEGAGVGFGPRSFNERTRRASDRISRHRSKWPSSR
jgi:NAD(P)-dependent dehydrogenase (short-subunit alcohol dehydrogenase family)